MIIYISLEIYNLILLSISVITTMVSKLLKNVDNFIKKMYIYQICKFKLMFRKSLIC